MWFIVTMIWQVIWTLARVPLVWFFSLDRVQLHGELRNRSNTVALSSCEAEYIATSAAAYQAVWLGRLLKKLRGEEPRKIKLLVDNKSVIALCKNILVISNCSQRLQRSTQFVCSFTHTFYWSRHPRIISLSLSPALLSSSLPPLS
jgi:hypothetical protein